MEKVFTIKNEQEMINFGNIIGKLAFPNMVISIEGTLGAGKTVLAKGIGQGLGVKDVINSPTFTIMKIYPGRLTFYHLDVYRLSSGEEDFDLEEYFEKDGVSYIEWGKNILDLLPKNRLEIVIDINDDLTRVVKVKAYGSQYEAFLNEVSKYENYDS